MSGFTLDITRDWLRHESGDAHESFYARVDWCGSGEVRVRWPLSHSGARDMVEAIRGTPDVAGDRVRRWGVFLRPQNAPAAEGFGFIARRVGIIDGEVSGYEGEAGQSIVMEGWSDDAILNGALSYPDSAQDSTSTTAGTWATYAPGPWASAEAALLEPIRANLGPGAVSRRRLAHFGVPAGSGRGPAVNLSRRVPTLLAWVREVCLLSGLSLRVARTGAASGDRLTVQVREQETRPEVRWSRHAKTLAGVGLFFEDAPSSVLTGGQGDGTARIFRRTDSPVPAQGFPWEVWKDDTSAQDAVELLTSGLERLAEETVEPSAVINPRPDGLGPVLGLDYLPGDLTPVDAGTGPLTTSATLRVEGVTVTHERSGAWLVTPQLGTPVDDEARVLDRLFRDQRRAGGR